MIEYRGATIIIKPHTRHGGGYEIYIRNPSTAPGGGRYSGIRTCRAYAIAAAKNLIDQQLDTDRIANLFLSMPLRAQA